LSDPLGKYLTSRLPEGIPFEDAVNLCMRLYCTVEGVPPPLHTWATPDSLATTFASLGARGWILGVTNQADASSRVFWESVVDSVTRGHPWIYDTDRCEAAAAPFVVSSTGASSSDV